MKNIVKEIENYKIGKYITNSPLSKYTSYKVGGNAKLIVYPNNVKKLIKLLEIIKSNNLKFIVLGNATNVVFSDKPYKGIIIKLDLLNDLKINDGIVTVQSGYGLSKLSNELSKSGLTGLEFACGIPGSIGGAIYMNAGAYGSCMQNIVKSINVITPKLELKTISNTDCKFDHRYSFLKDNKDYICVSATLKLEVGNKEEINDLIKDRIKKRWQAQPLEFPNAGSVFKNPGDKFAGKLIEDLSLKGYTIGGAQISEKHANFIINKNNASAKDIKTLINYIRKKVKKEYNINLETEQELINF